MHGVAFLCLVAVFFGSVAAAGAAEATAGADFVSAYVWRGITLNDGRAVQPYVDVAADRLSINVWGNYDIEDYGGTLDENEFSEIDLSLSYAFSSEKMDLRIGHMEYLFPNGGPGSREVFLSAHISNSEHLSAGIAAYYDYDEIDDYYLSATLAYDVALSGDAGMTASATAGYAGDDFSIGPEKGWHEYTLSLNASYPFGDGFELSAFIAYTDTLDEDVLPEQDVDYFGGGGFSWKF